MIGEQNYNEKVEQEAFKISSSIYLKEPSEASKLNREKQALRKRLIEIEAQENKINPEIIAEQKARLREAVKKHIRETNLTNNQINLFSQQSSHITKEGVMAFGY